MLDDARRFFDGTCQHGPDFAVFEHQQAADGAARGSRNVVPKSGRMAVRLKHHLGGTEHGLRDELKGKIAA
jgi:hypothetical protein